MHMKLTRRTKALATIVVTSFVLTVLLFFTDESRYSFAFLARSGELGLFAFFTVAFSIVPLAIYGFVCDRNNDKSLQWAFPGICATVDIVVLACVGMKYLIPIGIFDGVWVPVFENPSVVIDSHHEHFTFIRRRQQGVLGFNPGKYSQVHPGQKSLR